MPPSITKHALANSLLTVLYIILVAIFMYNGEAIFGGNKTPLVPISLLLLFVFSATVCGTLMFGRPILWYLDGQKKDAIKLFGYTLLSFFITAIIVFILGYTLMM